MRFNQENASGLPPPQNVVRRLVGLNDAFKELPIGQIAEIKRYVQARVIPEIVHERKHGSARDRSGR
jgi:hypothetical protein